MRSDPTSTRTIRCVRTDMASYYTGHEFSSTLRKKGIIQQFSAPYVPQQNGLAERLNRTIIEAERTAIHQSQMSIMFWGYALEAASLSYNLTPHAANDFLSPHELLFGEAPSVNNLKPFGISCTYLLQGNIQKFDQKGRSANLIGYTPFTKAYKLWDSLDQKLVLTNDVKFVNNSTVDDDNNDNSNQDSNANANNDDNDNNAKGPANDNRTSSHHETTPHNIEEHSQRPPRSAKSNAFNNISTLKGARALVSQLVLDDNNNIDFMEDGTLHALLVEHGLDDDYSSTTHVALLAKKLDDPDCPTLKQALKGPNAAKWREGIIKELDTLWSTGTWEAVKRASIPDGKQ